MSRYVTFWVAFERGKFVPTGFVTMFKKTCQNTCRTITLRGIARQGMKPHSLSSALLPTLVTLTNGRSSARGQTSPLVLLVDYRGHYRLRALVPGAPPRVGRPHNGRSGPARPAPAGLMCGWQGQSGSGPLVARSWTPSP